MARDELSGWIGSFDRYASKGRSGSDAANWLSMFNAESLIIDRKSSDPPTICIPKAAVSICGGIQPQVLKRALGKEHVESGLAARLLLTEPPRTAKRWTDAEIDPEVEAALDRLVGKLFTLQDSENADGNIGPGIVTLNPEAAAAWVGYYNAHGVEQAELTGAMAAAWSKLEEYAARLALVHHLIRWAVGDVTDEFQIDKESMIAAIAMTNWFKGEARRFYETQAESDADRELHNLMNWIERKQGEVTVRQVQQGYRKLKKPGEAEAALDELVKGMHGRWCDRPAGTVGGRPRRTFVLYSSPKDEPAHDPVD